MKVERVNCPKLTVHAISFTMKQNVCCKEFSTESYKTMKEWTSKNLLRSVSALEKNLMVTIFREHSVRKILPNVHSIWDSMQRTHNQRDRTRIMGADQRHRRVDHRWWKNTNLWKQNHYCLWHQWNHWLRRAIKMIWKCIVQQLKEMRNNLKTHFWIKAKIHQKVRIWVNNILIFH
jgi:hypothetical protein